MDSVSLIATAVAVGAAAGLKDSASQAIKDAYSGVKDLLKRRYAELNLAPLEARPKSAAKRDSLSEDLADAGAGSDGELLALAQALVETVRRHDREVAVAIGIDIENVSAQFLRIAEVRAADAGVVVRDSQFAGGIDIGKVDAGQPPKAEGR